MQDTTLGVLSLLIPLALHSNLAGVIICPTLMDEEIEALKLIRYQVQSKQEKSVFLRLFAFRLPCPAPFFLIPWPPNPFNPEC